MSMEKITSEQELVSLSNKLGLDLFVEPGPHRCDGSIRYDYETKDGLVVGYVVYDPPKDGLQESPWHSTCYWDQDIADYAIAGAPR